MRTIKVGLIGLGTVGGGVVEIFKKHREDFRHRAGVDVVLAAAADRNEERFAQLGLEPTICTTDAFEVARNTSLDIIIELIGGTGVAHDVVIAALEAGNCVVTANKALMASAGQEVLELAKEKGLDVRFEASVGGGIPIIGPLKHSLISNEISSVMGIVNGTTNYMLTRMTEDGLSYDDALAEAQAKGFAEADPTADVDGFDAAAKIAILASIAFNSRVTLDQVPTEGIRSLAASDIEYANEIGYTVKLLAIARRTDKGIDVRVHPTMIPSGHPLASVNGVYNAIYVVGDAVGETMFFGEGAGAGAAASAVVGDVLEVARALDAGNKVVGCTCVDNLPIRPMSELEDRYYVRIIVDDKPGVLASTAATFAQHGVSVESLIQRCPRGKDSAELVYVTHRATEACMTEAFEAIRQLDAVQSIAAVIRVEDI